MCLYPVGVTVRLSCSIREMYVVKCSFIPPFHRAFHPSQFTSRAYASFGTSFTCARTHRDRYRTILTPNYFYIYRVYSISTLILCKNKIRRNVRGIAVSERVFSKVSKVSKFLGKPIDLSCNSAGILCSFTWIRANPKGLNAYRRLDDLLACGNGRASHDTEAKSAE